MSKPVLGIVLGGILGVFDGLTGMPSTNQGWTRCRNQPVGLCAKVTYPVPGRRWSFCQKT